MIVMALVFKAKVPIWILIRENSLTTTDWNGTYTQMYPVAQAHMENLAPSERFFLWKNASAP